jgi:hypothetical protein
LLLERGQPSAARAQFERALVLKPGAGRGSGQVAGSGARDGNLAEAEPIDAALRQTLARADADATAAR